MLDIIQQQQQQEQEYPILGPRRYANRGQKVGQFSNIDQSIYLLFLFFKKQSWY